MMDALKKNIDHLNKEIEHIKASIDEIKIAIIGNEKFGQEGLVNMVRRHEEYIEKDKRFKNKLIGAGAILGTIWTIILKFGDKIF